MTNNDILRRLRYLFDFSDQQAVELFSLDPGSTAPLSSKEFKARLLNDEDQGFCLCSDAELCAFMDGLIVLKRGLRDNATKQPTAPADFRLSKNDVLKKLRIAMNYREQEMLQTLKLGGTEMSKSELGALFRSPKHKHYRPAGNQVLRAFIKGLTMQLRV